MFLVLAFYKFVSLYEKGSGMTNNTVSGEDLLA
jgi:hypothetical protein